MTDFDLCSSQRNYDTWRGSVYIDIPLLNLGPNHIQTPCSLASQMFKLKDLWLSARGIKTETMPKPYLLLFERTKSITLASESSWIIVSAWMCDLLPQNTTQYTQTHKKFQCPFRITQQSTKLAMWFRETTRTEYLPHGSVSLHDFGIRKETSSIRNRISLCYRRGVCFAFFSPRCLSFSNTGNISKHLD